jgi:hypothetical protein
MSRCRNNVLNGEMTSYNSVSHTTFIVIKTI